MKRWDIKRRRHDAKAEAQRLVQQYLLGHPCVDCGEGDPVVLEFDHRNPEEKRSTISELIRRGASVDRLSAEVSLCDVRCANCHRRRTAYQGVSWRIRDRMCIELEYEPDGIPVDSSDPPPNFVP